MAFNNNVVVNGFDFDPVSVPPANGVDGLTSNWSGRVFLNPPYGIPESIVKELIEQNPVLVAPLLGTAQRRPYGI